MIRISPSILSADFAALGEAVRKLTAAGADAIHVDVMDGHFVPNLTIGPEVVKALRPHTHLPLDVHLMIEHPEALIPAFAEAGADSITVHIEAVTHLDRVLRQIRDLGKEPGVSLVPSTPETALRYILPALERVLVMTVNPGFGGQRFLESQLPKIHAIRAMITAAERPITLEVDGGIQAQTAALAIHAGADMLVAGSYIFGAGPDAYAAQIQHLRAA